MIFFPSGPYWRIYDYVQGANNPIEDWYQALPFEAQQQFNNLLKQIRKTERPIEWLGFKRFLQGKLREEKIWELDFRAGKRQYRVLGVFGSVRKQAILVMGCYHKQRVYTPEDALQTAYRRSKALRKGLANFRERQIQTDF